MSNPVSKRSINKPSISSKYPLKQERRRQRSSDWTATLVVVRGGEEEEEESIRTVSTSGEQEENECIGTLMNVCNGSYRNLALLSNEMNLFRYACLHSFNARKAKAAIEGCRNRNYLSLEMEGRLKEQFYTQTLFPLPGLRTKDGNSEVFYMRPSRYFPRNTDTRLIIQNLCYVLNDMSDTKEKCRNGVAFVANMDGWTMDNFSMDYCKRFMHALQGHAVPTKVELFLIVDPPGWFGKIWRIMKSMLSRSFSKKVRIVEQTKLRNYLQEGFEEYLPDEMDIGLKDTTLIVDDYVHRRSILDISEPQNLHLEKDGSEDEDVKSRTEEDHTDADEPATDFSSSK
eukprot:scaffold8966_cov73-Cylindrotheca_fusiformis.AAC.4